MADVHVQSPTRRKRPTQADVARLAAVSQPVVSYVLSGVADAPVAPATRQRVLAAIAELGYVPDHAARALRGRRTLTVAVAIPDITNPFYPAFVRGIQDVATGHGFAVVSFNTDGDLDQERACLRFARAGRVDGLIITPFGLPPAELAALADAGLAVVAMAEADVYRGAGQIDAVFVDNAAAAKAAVDHLLDRGHTRIGMVAGRAGTPPREGRVRGYAAALAARGLPVDRLLVRGGEFTVDGGIATTAELLRLADRPTAIFAANDLMAMGALETIRAAALRVPGDIALVGFDDIPAARLVTPPLTTIAQYPEQLGRRAADLLFDRLAGNAPPVGRREERPFDLIVRASG